MKTPTVLIFGNNTIGSKCLSYLIKNNENVVGVVPEPNDNCVDTWQKSFRKCANELGVKIYDVKNINDKDFLQTIKKLDIDYIFSFQCRRLLKKELISIPKGGCFNLHFSLLPKHRGCHVIAWTLLNGDEEGGITLMSINESIDSGDIVFQKKFKIPLTMTARELFDKCTEEGYELFKEVYFNIKNGDLKLIPQDESQSSYHKMGSINFDKKQIKWNEDFKELHNWCRAFIFPPFQYPVTSYEGSEIEIVKLNKPIKNNIHDPGKIISVNNGIDVAAKNGAISIKAVKIKNKIFPAYKFIEEYNLKPGSRFEMI